MPKRHRHEGLNGEYEPIRIGDAAIVGWVCPVTQQRLSSRGKLVPAFDNFLVERLFLGLVVATPAATARGHVAPTGLRRAKPPAPRAEMYMLSEVRELGRVILEEIPYEEWRAGVEQIDYDYRPHIGNLVIDPQKPNITIERASAVPVEVMQTAWSGRYV